TEDNSIDEGVLDGFSADVEEEARGVDPVPVDVGMKEVDSVIVLELPSGALLVDSLAGSAVFCPWLVDTATVVDVGSAVVDVTTFSPCVTFSISSLPSVLKPTDPVVSVPIVVVSVALGAGVVTAPDVVMKGTEVLGSVVTSLVTFAAAGVVEPSDAAEGLEDSTFLAEEGVVVALVAGSPLVPSVELAISVVGDTDGRDESVTDALGAGVVTAPDVVVKGTEVPGSVVTSLVTLAAAGIVELPSDAAEGLEDSTLSAEEGVVVSLVAGSPLVPSVELAISVVGDTDGRDEGVTGSALISFSVDEVVDSPPLVMVAAVEVSEDLGVVKDVP
ncbi:unnamed protein product, partial [Strongylus vulgaris]